MENGQNPAFLFSPQKMLSALDHSPHNPEKVGSENILRKRENSGKQHFLHFLQCFKKHFLDGLEMSVLHITIVETWDSSERGMNSIAMTSINPRRESRGQTGDQTSNVSFKIPLI